MTAHISPSSSWLKKSLLAERWFDDGKPSWQHLPTASAAQVERKKRVRLLRKHGEVHLSEVLDQCAPRARCFSGCCPECGRAFQRFFVASSTKLLTPHTDYDTVSIVGRTHRKPNNLHSLAIDTFSDRLLYSLRSGRAGLAVGGIDFSFNEPGHNKKGRWVPHFWVLVHNGNRSRWERTLRKAWPAQVHVPRPIKIKNWDGDIKALGYALKTNFQRRIATRTSRFARDAHRTCKNTQSDRLRSCERSELFVYLHNIGLEARLILFNVIKVKGGFDVAKD